MDCTEGLIKTARCPL